MRNFAGFVFGAVAGTTVTWFALSDPPYVLEMKEQVENGHDFAYALHKLGSGQVAVIHGFVDDYEVCNILRNRLQQNGGIYSCISIAK